MEGWGRRYLVVAPDGRVLPCQAAHTLPGLAFDSVVARPLDWIWRESEAFARFRGEAWMPEPCRSCDQRAVDFGGCRCQAYHLTGDMTATDPACVLAPRHDLVLRARHDAAAASVESAPPSVEGATATPVPPAEATIPATRLRLRRPPEVG